MLYRFDRLTKREDGLVALDQDLFRVADAIDDSRILVEEYGGVIEIVDLSTTRKIRKIAGVHSTLNSARTLIAWQTPVDTVLHRDDRSHVLISNVDGSEQLDLGEGSVPVFLPDNTTLMFLRFEQSGEHLDVIRYNVITKVQDVKATNASEINDAFKNPYGLTVSPGEKVILLSACCGRHGSAVFWKLMSDQNWTMLDDNLGGWSGWSSNGLLAYGTDGRDLRSLDPRRSVWVADIRILDSQNADTRTIVEGVSQNGEPRWCGWRGDTP